jgi:hypothetical protein
MSPIKTPRIIRGIIVHLPRGEGTRTPSMSPIKTPRIIRGTSWAYRDPCEDRAEIRVCNGIEDRLPVLGFRCALRGRQPVRA